MELHDARLKCSSPLTFTGRVSSPGAEEDVMKIQQWVFDRDRWVSAPRAGKAPSEITVVTYNTWFGRFYFEERMEALIDELAGCDADVIALQEGDAAAARHAGPGAVGA